MIFFKYMIVFSIFIVLNLNAKVDLDTIIARDDVNAIKSAVVDHKVDLKQTDEFGNTLVHLVARKAKPKILKYLHSKGLSLTSRNNMGYTPLYEAITNTYYDDNLKNRLEVIDYLLSNSVDINKTDEYNTPLIEIAIRYSSINIVKHLLKQQIFLINKKQLDDYLIIAASTSKIDLIDFFISKGADIDVKNESGESLIYIATNNGQIKTVKYFLYKGLDINSKNKYDESLLFCRTYDFKLMKFLIENGVDINATNSRGNTLIHHVTKYGYLKLLKYLLKNYFSISQKNADGNSLLHSAAEGGHIEVFKWLDSKYDFPITMRNKNSENVIDIALKENDTKDIIIYCLDKYPSEFQSSLLSLKLNDSLASQWIRFGKKFINTLAPHLSKNQQDIVFKAAIDKNAISILKFLIEFGINPDLKSSKGENILHILAKSNNVEDLKWFIEHGADINSRDKKNKTPLFNAVLFDKEQNTQILTQHNADITLLYDNGKNILFYALLTNNEKIIKYILAKIKNINYKANNGETPLHIAAKNSSLSIIKLLVSHGADLNIKNNFKVTPLMLLSKRNTIDINNYLHAIGMVKEEIKYIKPYVFSQHNISASALNFDFSTMAIYGNSERKLYIWDMKILKEVKTFEVNIDEYDPKMVFIGKNKILITNKNKINIYDLNLEQLITTLELDSSVKDIDISKDNVNIAVSTSKKVYLINAKTLKKQIVYSRYYQSTILVDFGNNDEEILITDNHNYIRYNILEKTKNDIVLKNNESSIENLIYSDDGKNIIQHETYYIKNNLYTLITFYKKDKNGLFKQVYTYKPNKANLEFLVDFDDELNMTIIVNIAKKSIFAINIDKNFETKIIAKLDNVENLNKIDIKNNFALVIDYTFSRTGLFILDLQNKKVLKKFINITIDLNDYYVDDKENKLYIGGNNLFYIYDLKKATLYNKILDRGYFLGQKDKVFVFRKTIKDSNNTFVQDSFYGKTNKQILKHTKKFNIENKIVIHRDFDKKEIVYFDEINKTLIRESLDNQTIYIHTIDKVVDKRKHNGFAMFGPKIEIRANKNYIAYYTKIYDDNYSPVIYLIKNKTGEKIVKILAANNFKDFAFIKDSLILLYKDKVQIYSISLKKITSTIKLSPLKAKKISTISKNGKYMSILGTIKTQDTLVIINLDNKKLIKKFNSKEYGAYSSFLENSNLVLYENAHNKMVLFSLDADKKIYTFNSLNEDVYDSFFYNDTIIGFVISWSKVILYDLKNKNELATIYSFDDGWLIITPEGYFTGDGNYVDKIIFRDGFGNNYSINQFYDQLFRPDLVKLKLNTGDISKYINGLTTNEAFKNPPPKLSFNSIDHIKIKALNFKNSEINSTKEKISLSFNVTQQNKGGVGLIRVYQEGKLIQTIGEGKIKKQVANIDIILEQEKLDKTMKKNQKLFIASMSKSVQGDACIEDTIAMVEPEKSINEAGTYKIEVELKSGKNEISIEAFNKTNTITSYREKVTIHANIPKHKPKLYAIVAGVNEFESKSVNNLKYSQNDARDIKQELQNKMGSVFDKVEITYLLGKDVTKANILKAIQKISKVAKLEDSMLFYISTHGRAHRGKLYLVPQNNKNFRNWIDFEQTFKAIQSIKALNQIFIIDACESGEANDIVSSVYDSRASVLAKSSGVHMLLATTKGTSAFEHPDPNIKNGVFTYKILQAVEDNATDKNGDGFISVIELSKKLKEPKNNTNYQYPVIRNIGNDIYFRKIR